MNYISVTIKTTNTEQAEILLAALANDGYEAFEESDDGLKAYISEKSFNQQILEAIFANRNIAYSISVIEQQNWNAKWESSFEPVVIENFAVVRAAFHSPVKNIKHEIIITPKMSFGTGHHATTYLMMQQMSRVDFSNKKVFDFGTGTGVLAILAEKMGAAHIDAIDNDEWSIENTIENITANNCTNINIKKAEKINTQSEYDVILANINLNVLLLNMQDIAAICKPGAIVLFSGILVADEPVLKESAFSNRLIFSEIMERSGWLCIKATKGL